MSALGVEAEEDRKFCDFRLCPTTETRPIETGKSAPTRAVSRAPSLTERGHARRRPAAAENNCSDQKLEVMLLRRTGGRVEQFLAVHLISADCLLAFGRNQPIYEPL